MTFKLSLKVRSFQAKKNSMCRGPVAGRNRLAHPECKEQDAALLRWTESDDYVSIFQHQFGGCKDQHVET